LQSVAIDLRQNVELKHITKIRNVQAETEYPCAARPPPTLSLLATGFDANREFYFLAPALSIHD